MQFSGIKLNTDFHHGVFHHYNVNEKTTKDVPIF